MRSAVALGLALTLLAGPVLAELPKIGVDPLIIRPMPSPQIELDEEPPFSAADVCQTAEQKLKQKAGFSDEEADAFYNTCLEAMLSKTGGCEK